MMIWNFITIYKPTFPQTVTFPRDLGGAIVYYMPERMKEKCINYKMADHL
jgi:hypothetical protein